MRADGTARDGGRCGGACRCGAILSRWRLSSHRPAAIRIRCTTSWRRWRSTTANCRRHASTTPSITRPPVTGSIATGCREPSTSLCRDDESFQAGLLEAVTQVVVDQRVVALIAYDLPYPEPLAAVRRIVAPLGVALVLTPERTERTVAELEIALSQGAVEPTGMADFELEGLRTGNPAGRGLPLLAALAGDRAALIELELGRRSRITVAVTPSCR